MLLAAWNSDAEPSGEVAECTGDNIFIVQDGRLLTPPVEAGVLEGITRGAVMELAAEDDVEVVETTMTLEDVYAAEEVFLTGSAAEIVPVIKVDGNKSVMVHLVC